MKIQDFIAEHLKGRLEEARSLVVYDPEGRYHDLVLAMAEDRIAVVDGCPSTILGREAALDAWLRMGTDDRLRLLVYLPIPAPVSERDIRDNPYQIFALGGGVFPAGQNESYDALCRQAAPDLSPRIDALFESETPDFETVNHLLAGGANWPQLKRRLKAESAAEILTAVLSPTPEQETALVADAAWVPEFRTFFSTVLGGELHTRSQSYPALRDEAWRFILFSEFVLDLPGDPPEALGDVPRASARYADLVFTVCDRLRAAENHQQAYLEAAEAVAEDLKIEARAAGIMELGERDTFAFEERVYLQVFADAIRMGEFDEAARLAHQRRKSIWIKQRGERDQLWTVAERARELLMCVRDLQGEMGGVGRTAGDLFAFYRDRFRLADRRHRDFEQAVADTYGEHDVLDGLIEQARRGYFRAAESLQARFLEAVAEEGWPVSGQIRHGEVFDRFVSPWLKERKKVAFFMVDALRYELAAALDAELSERWNTELAAVCAQLPTVTAVGMAALMPGADGKLRLVKEKDELVPHVQGERVLLPKDRLRFIQRMYGDRCAARNLDELVTKKRIVLADTTQLLLVKTTDIDQFGEINPLEARRLIPRLTRKIIAGVNRIRKLGFDHAVIATDHGFVLFDEQQAGDGVAKPPGDWRMAKTRCLLGKCAVSENVRVFSKSDVGIDGDFEDYVVPRSFGTFVKGHPYAHEGLSLQECVLPVVHVDFGRESAETAKPPAEISLSYKGGKTDRITTRRPMIQVSMFAALFDEPVEFQLEAESEDGTVIGETASSPDVNPATGMVTIRPRDVIKIPLKMNEDFHGRFSVKALDPVTRVTHAVLELQTNILE